MLFALTSYEVNLLLKAGEDENYTGLNAELPPLERLSISNPPIEFKWAPFFLIFEQSPCMDEKVIINSTQPRPSPPRRCLPATVCGSFFQNYIFAVFSPSAREEKKEKKKLCAYERFEAMFSLNFPASLLSGYCGSLFCDFIISFHYFQPLSLSCSVSTCLADRVIIDRTIKERYKDCVVVEEVGK